MEELFATLIVLTDSQKAHIIQAELESAGITAYISDEVSSQLFGGYASGGIRVQVKESDLEKATAIMSELGYKSHKYS